ncbi:hypothetical protein [Mycobacterium adipatum]|uniref:hypothetical protein n=1 Tax=Mycobacterium adipatum TaxID=1682113 RepID=UPI0012E8AEBB|nr:hypothetical protein [Mycobacterium adipatum]MBI5738723.1 hypothetical protein [Mycolicibacterium neoaurum]
MRTTGGAFGRAGARGASVGAAVGMGPSGAPAAVSGSGVTRILATGVGRQLQNLPISNNFQQTKLRPSGRWVDTYGRCVLSWMAFSMPPRVPENMKFLDNDFITASR